MKSCGHSGLFYRARTSFSLSVCDVKQTLSLYNSESLYSHFVLLVSVNTMMTRMMRMILHRNSTNL